MVEVLTMIALWCGSPYRIYTIGPADRERKDVNECRERMMKCFEDKSFYFSKDKIFECARKEKL